MKLFPAETSKRATLQIILRQTVWSLTTPESWSIIIWYLCKLLFPENVTIPSASASTKKTDRSFSLFTTIHVVPATGLRRRKYNANEAVALNVL